MNKKGFTIVELVIVIAVIAILAAVLIPTFAGVVSKADDSSALQTARSTLTNALNMSSTAQLAGQDEDQAWHTIFLAKGHAYGYTGNSLEAINYPNTKGTSTLTMTNFNAFLLAAQDLKEVEDVAAVTGDDVTGKYVEVSSGTSGAVQVNSKFYAVTSDTHAQKDVVYYTYTPAADPTPASVVEFPVSKVDVAAVAGSLELSENTIKIIKDATGWTDVTLTKVNGAYKINNDYDVYFNSDFAKEVVVLTKFG